MTKTRGSSYFQIFTKMRFIIRGGGFIKQEIVRPFVSLDRDYKLFICGADVVQKCEEFPKKTFF